MWSRHGWLCNASSMLFTPVLKVGHPLRIHVGTRCRAQVCLFFFFLFFFTLRQLWIPENKKENSFEKLLSSMNVTFTDVLLHSLGNKVPLAFRYITSITWLWLWSAFCSFKLWDIMKTKSTSGNWGLRTWKSNLHPQIFHTVSLNAPLSKARLSSGAVCSVNPCS